MIFFRFLPLFSYKVLNIQKRIATMPRCFFGKLFPKIEGQNSSLKANFFSLIMEDMDEVYAVIDMKSFYASCECAARGLDIFSTPLAVCDPERTENTIVMSVTPYLKKKYGAKNVERMKDLPKVDGMIYAKPRMAYYVKTSAKVVSIFLDFVSEEDLHVYSIDESFLRLTPYLGMYRCSAEELVFRIQKRIKDELGLIATAGLGPNMFLAKVCLDQEGKKKPPFIARWSMEDVPTKLWKIPLMDVWGISGGIATRLRKMGISTLEGVAKTDVSFLQEEFGIMGVQLHDLANGIDRTDIRKKYVPKERSLSVGQTLIRDYSLDEAKLILREMTDDVCYRLRLAGQKARVVSLYMGYSASSGGGFSAQSRLNWPSDSNEKIYQTVLGILSCKYDGSPIRNLGVSLGGLCEEENDQLSLFQGEDEERKQKQIWGAIDQISARYGRNAVLRASSLKEESTIKERHQQIGGHHA